MCHQHRGDRRYPIYSKALCSKAVHLAVSLPPLYPCLQRVIPREIPCRVRPIPLCLIC
jgi:hypothetical protein